MSFVLFSCLALPLWAGMYVLYFSLRKQRAMFYQCLVAKCCGSFLSVASAATALLLKGKNPLTHGAFWFFLLCTAADALLEISFLPGMLLFAAAHICLITYLWSTYPPTVWTLVLWLAIILGALLLFWRQLPGMGYMAIFGTLYVAILAGTLALSLCAPFTARRAALWPLALGALSFFTSDMILARIQFANLGSFWQKPVMITYWAALYLISASLWI